MSDGGQGAYLPLAAELIDEETLARLFRDVESFAEILAVSVKGRAGFTEEIAPTIRAARDALALDSSRGVQIRYRFDGRLWRDTLLKTRDGLRLVRAPT